MPLAASLSRSASSVAAGFVGGRRCNYHRGCFFSAINHSRHVPSNNVSLSSASPAISEIQFAKKSIEEVEGSQRSYDGPRFMSDSSVVPVAPRFIGGQRRFNHHYTGTFFSGINHREVIHKIPSSALLSSSVSRYSSAASPDLSGPSRQSSELGADLQKAFQKYLETRGRIRRSLRSVFNELENQKKRKIKKIDLHTDCLEVNYRTLKTVVFEPPTLAHIPYGVRYARRKKLREIKKLQEIKAIKAKRSRARPFQTLG